MAGPAAIGVEEEYYQISEAVLASFPKYRLPLDLFSLDAKVAQLNICYKKNSRLTNEQVEALQNLCGQGNLFVSRADHPIYSQHIVKQLDLVLLDENLRPAEVAEIILTALEQKLAAFFEQPVKPVYQPLYEDLLVFTEYLWADRHRIKSFMRRLHTGDYSLTKHSLNTMLVGLWLFLQDKGDGASRKELNALALGLMLHDVGMSKVPNFILDKDKPLKPEERDKILTHVLTGAQILQKMDLVAPEAQAACLEHHERLDGSGYPQKSRDLTVVGRIAGVADSFSAMIQKRVYAEALESKEAARQLTAEDTRYDRRFSMPLLTAFLTGAFK